MKTLAKTPLAPKPRAAAKDAIAILRADHGMVSELFAAYKKSKSSQKKLALITEICTELSVHTQVEEEIFYPAIKSVLKDKMLVPEATVEHAGVRSLIAQIEGLKPDDEFYEATVKVLSEYVKHHINEEQNEMFPKAKATSLDMVELGSRIVARKAELLAARG